ncbi:hypothetical protein ACVWZR_000996 [Bradyrhizobium sp. i1.3.1]
MPSAYGRSDKFRRRAPERRARPTKSELRHAPQLDVQTLTVFMPLSASVRDLTPTTALQNPALTRSPDAKIVARCKSHPYGLPKIIIRRRCAGTGTPAFVKAHSAGPARSSGHGNDVAADRLCGGYCLFQLPPGPQRRDTTRAGDGAKHAPRARFRSAADDRRLAGAGAQQRPAKRRLRRLPPAGNRVHQPIWRGQRPAGGGRERAPAVLDRHE